MTHPGSRHLAQQRIHIDVCTLSCFDPTPRLPHNYYAIELGTRELIINTQSKRESFTDKLLAVALRNRLQPRDLWDLAWIKQTTADTSLLKLKEKLREQGVPHQHFIERLRTIQNTLANRRLPSANYIQDLGRFLPTRSLKTLENPYFWRYVGGLVEEQTRAAQRVLLYNAADGKCEQIAPLPAQFPNHSACKSQELACEEKQPPRPAPPDLGPRPSRRNQSAPRRQSFTPV